MTIDALREHCLARPAVTESFPFGEDTLVFKVGGKIFALLDLRANPASINLKCDPERSADLRERYEAVRPGYHMNKLHWNTVVADGTVPGTEIRGLIDHSYELVVASLSRKQREALG